MKNNFLAVIVTFCMLFSLIPMGAKADSSDIIDFFVENNVDPDMFGMLLMSVTAPGTGDNDTYILRNIEELDSITFEIGVMASEYGELDADQLKGHLLTFMDYFNARGETELSMFLNYLNRTKSAVLPIGIQDTADIMFPSIKNIISDEFYSMTVFMNILNDFNTVYYNNNNKTPFLNYSGGKIKIRSNGESVCNYSGSILRKEDEGLIRFYYEKVYALMALIADCPEYDISGFADYLLSCGILSDSSSHSAEIDETVNSLYEAYYSECASGNSTIGAFVNPEEIAGEYADSLSNAYGGEFNALLKEALDKAAVVTVKDGTSSLSLANNSFLLFAALNALKTRNLLIEKGIAVPADRDFDIRVFFEGRSSKSVSIALPSDAFTYSNTSGVTNFIFDTGIARLTVNGGSALSGTVLGSGLTNIMINEQDAATLLGNSKITQKAVTIKLMNGMNEITGNIQGSTALLSIPGGGNTNYMYGIKSSDNYALVTGFEYDGEFSSFAMGTYRSFAYISGGIPGGSNNNNDNNNDDGKGGGKGTSFVDGSAANNDNTNTGNNSGNDTNDNTEAKPDRKPEREIVANVSFTDVTDNHWAKDYIYRLAGYGIINGMGGGLFMPENNITREQFAKILVEAFYLTDETATTDFTDVEKGSWYEPYVAAAQKKGIINGIGNGAFGVGSNITRQDMAVMITRAVDAANINLISVGGAPNFSDMAEIADYARISVRILNAAQIISGYEDNTFRPKQYATRAQASKIISMLIDLE